MISRQAKMHYIHKNSAGYIVSCGNQSIGHVNEFPTMHYFGIPRHTQSMIAYIILTEYFWKF